MKRFHTTSSFLFVAMVFAAACAKPFSPPGGPQDRTPPRLVSVTPAALAVLPDFNGKIVFTFNETLAERGVNDAAVSVSPQPRGKVHVARKGNRIEVSALGGWARNQVYRVVVKPGVTDRFGNARKDAVEIVFSTGPPITETAIAGIITDRITGRPALDAALEAVRRADSAVYNADGDSAGFFALRNIPAGVYDVRAFQDGNHNRRRDITESASVYQQIALGSTDTIPAELTLLPADTTPPDLRRADVTDTMHITLGFDDAIDNLFGLGNATLAIMTADSQNVQIGHTMQLKNIQVRRDAAARAAAPHPAAPDSTKLLTHADSLRADSIRAVRARADSAQRAAAERNSAGGQRVAPDTTSLPDRDVVVTFSVALPPGKYRAIVTGIRNVNGLAGGGHADFEIKAPAPRPGRSGGAPKRDPARISQLHAAAPRERTHASAASERTHASASDAIDSPQLLHR